MKGKNEGGPPAGSTRSRRACASAVGSGKGKGQRVNVCHIQTPATVDSAVRVIACQQALRLWCFSFPFSFPAHRNLARLLSRCSHVTSRDSPQMESLLAGYILPETGFLHINGALNTDFRTQPLKIP